MATHAERQRAYRERQGWAGRRKNRDRMRDARKGNAQGPCVTIGTSVRDAKRMVRAPREVQETHYETDDEAYEREHPRVLPPKMEPAQEVVVHDVIGNTNMRGRAAPETSQQLPDPIDMTPEERKAAFNVMKRTRRPGVAGNWSDGDRDAMTEEEAVETWGKWMQSVEKRVEIIGRLWTGT